MPYGSRDGAGAVACCVGGGLAFAGLLMLGSCWRPRSNSAAVGSVQPPAWDRGPRAAAEAQAGAAVQYTWDGEGFPFSIVGTSTDADRQRMASDLVTERILTDLEAGRVPTVEMPGSDTAPVVDSGPPSWAADAGAPLDLTIEPPWERH